MRAPTRILLAIPVVFLPWLCITPVSGGAAKKSAKPASKSVVREKQIGKRTEIPGAERIDSAQCQACHAEAATRYRRTAHSQQGLDCQDCHGSGSLHIKDGNGYASIIKFSAHDSASSNATCLSCHERSEALLTWSSGAHGMHDVACISCHRAHPVEAKLHSRREQNEACVTCHRKQAMEGNLPYHHPVREAKMACNDCHDPHGGPAANNLKTASLNQLCLGCHAEFEGPFTYQHVPVTESCLKCHTSHGSMHRNMLQVSEPMLCLQCHPGHHNGTGVPLLNRCTSCHSSIHGTDTPSATGGSVFIDKP
jgi:DmsE family decaheme c-type cytochrome